MKATEHFEKGAVLAWAVDVDKGYRASTGVTWRYAELGLFDGSVTLPDVVGAELVDVDITIAPGAEGKVRFVAGERLVVLGYGEMLPVLSEPAVEVHHGSVLRLGALLLAPLYEEQLESIREGRMTLPEVPLTALRAGRDDDGDDLAAETRARKLIAGRWSLSWGLAMVAAPVLSLGLLYLVAAIDGDPLWRMYGLGFNDLVGLTVCYWLGTFFFSLPIQISITRWLRTPGAGAELLPEGALGSRRARAIVGLAGALLFVPWLMGFASTVLLELSCEAGDSLRHVHAYETVCVSAIFSVVLTFLFFVISPTVSNGFRRLVVRWLASTVRRGKGDDALTG